MVFYGVLLLFEMIDRYYESFKSNSITYELLPELDEKYVDKLGIYAVGDRIRLEKALLALKPEVRMRK